MGKKSRGKSHRRVAVKRRASVATVRCVCGCDPQASIVDWDQIHAVMTGSAPDFDVVSGCTGKAANCADPTSPCMLDYTGAYGPVLDALTEWDVRHRGREAVRVVAWDERRIPRAVTPGGDEDGFATAARAQFEVTYGRLFGVHPRRYQQRFWVRDEAVMIATTIEGRAGAIDVMVPATCQRPEHDHESPGNCRSEHLTRAQAEVRLRAGKPMTNDILLALLVGRPDLVTTAGGATSDESKAGMKALPDTTASPRSARLALDGWALEQQNHGATVFEVHDWTDSRSLRVPLLTNSGGNSAVRQALATIEAAATCAEHRPLLQQRVWTAPNAVVVLTSAEGRMATIHTITARQPQRDLTLASAEK